MNFSGISRYTLAGRVLRIPLKLIPADTHLWILQGPLRGYRWIAGAATHGCWLGSYEQEKQNAFIRFIRSASVVYDIGANVGFYTLLAAHLVGKSGRVIAFEPLPRNLEYLREHITLNRLSNVEVVEAAVSTESGTAMFDDQANPSMGKLSSCGTVAVRTVTIDDLVGSGAIPSPDLVKIDVEGAEYNVLRGASRTLEKKRPVIFIATHGEELRTQCLTFLRGHSYKVRSASKASMPLSDEFVATAVAPRLDS